MLNWIYILLGKMVLTKKLQVNHIPYVEKSTNIFTKVLYIFQFLVNRHKLDVINIPLSLRGTVKDTNQESQQTMTMDQMTSSNKTSQQSNAFIHKNS